MMNVSIPPSFISKTVMVNEASSPSSPEEVSVSAVQASSPEEVSVSAVQASSPEVASQKNDSPQKTLLIRSNLHRLRVAQLREMCAQHGLPTGGKKMELIDKLAGTR